MTGLIDHRRLFRRLGDRLWLDDRFGFRLNNRLCAVPGREQFQLRAGETIVTEIGRCGQFNNLMYRGIKQTRHNSTVNGDGEQRRPGKAAR